MKYDGSLYFQFVNSHLGRVPHLHPVILPLVPCPFHGGTTSPSHNSSTGPMSFSGGTHLQSIILPLVPCPFSRYPSEWSHVPVPGGGYPVPGMGHPVPGGVSTLVPDGGYPIPWPWPGLGYLPGTGYVYTGYAAGGMPLAVFHRRTFLLNISYQDTQATPILRSIYITLMLRWKRSLAIKFNATEL